MSVALKKRQHGWPADSLAMALAAYRSSDIALRAVDLAAQTHLRKLA